MNVLQFYRPMTDASFLMCLASVMLFSFSGTAEETSNPKSSSTSNSDNQEKTDTKGLKLFKDHVRSILINKCVKCHGDKSEESELNIVTREGLLEGGASGEVIDVGNAEESWLYKLITKQEEPTMPFEGEQLTKQEIEYIKQWIDLDAPYDKPLLKK